MCKIFFGAVILALLFTRAGFWQLDRARQKLNLASVHHGELFDPVRSLAAMRSTRIGGGTFGPEELRGQWNLVWVTAAPCDRACRRQPGVRRRDFRGPKPNRGLFIVDPRFNVILRYENGADPEGVLKDLKRLLKYSWIG